MAEKTSPVPSQTQQGLSNSRTGDGVRRVQSFDHSRDNHVKRQPAVTQVSSSHFVPGSSPRSWNTATADQNGQSPTMPATALKQSGSLHFVPKPTMSMDITARRKRIASEFCSSEQSYVQSMECVYEKFIKPLRDDWEKNPKKPLLPYDEQIDIFCNWEVILNCHRNILKILTERIDAWTDGQTIGDIFVDSKNTGFLKLYKYYVNNFDKSVALMAAHRQKNTPFIQFCTEVEPECVGKLQLEAYLIMPVQRIPRYLLLFKDLSKHTLNTHPDFTNVLKAREQMKAFADYINSSKKSAEHQDRVQKVCSRIEGFPDWVLSIRNITIVKYGILRDSSGGQCFVVLLNNAVVFNTIKDEKKRQFKMQGLIWITDCTIQIEKGDDGNDMIVIVPNKNVDHIIADDQKSFKLIHEDPDLIAAWSIAFRKTKEVAANQKAADSSKPEIIDHDEKEERRIHVRRRLIVEFMKKEVQYVGTLKLMKQFISLLESSPSSSPSRASHDFFSELFSALLQVIDYHSKLFEALWRSLQTNSEEHNMAVGEVILANFDGLSVYAKFAEEWSKSREDYEQSLSRKSKYSKQILVFESEQGFSTVATLDRIANKVSNLFFLISELFQNTNPDHPDFKNLDIAVKNLQANKAKSEFAVTEKAHKRKATVMGLGKKKK